MHYGDRIFRSQLFQQASRNTNLNYVLELIFILFKFHWIQQKIKIRQLVYVERAVCETPPFFKVGHLAAVTKKLKCKQHIPAVCSRAGWLGKFTTIDTNENCCLIVYSNCDLEDGHQQLIV